jgi:Fe-S-cluster-containing hydrogenase component 2
MNLGLKKTKQTQTNTIILDTEKCMACWECFRVCPNNVIGRVNLPWHKHVRIANGNNCTGCSKCVKVCLYGALSQVELVKNGE